LIVIKVFDHSGKFVLDFGIIGQGPGEFIGPTQLMATEEEGGFSVFDPQARRVVKYQPDDILHGIFEPVKTTNIEEPSGIALRMAALRGGEFAALGTFS